MKETNRWAEEESARLGCLMNAKDSEKIVHRIKRGVRKFEN